MKFLRSFLKNDITFLEVGPGDCALSIEVAKFVKQVYAVDISDEITKILSAPTNFHLILSDGCSIPVPCKSVDVAYSNQLIEHLHPDDAVEQLQQIFKALTPGGVYTCITPNRSSGPHDVSKYFDEVATSLHLNEYTTLELSNLFRKAGFAQLRAYVGAKRKYIRLPIFLIAICETLLVKLEYIFRKTIKPNLLSRLVPTIRLIGVRVRKEHESTQL